MRKSYRKNVLIKTVKLLTKLSTYLSFNKVPTTVELMTEWD